jgi:hypothetical protein
MFKITQNTFKGFTLTEILLMVALNQVHATSKPGRSLIQSAPAE